MILTDYETKCLIDLLNGLLDRHELVQMDSMTLCTLEKIREKVKEGSP